jgi:hypothetical protein
MTAKLTVATLFVVGGLVLVGSFPLPASGRGQTSVLGTYSGIAADLGMGVDIGTPNMCGNLRPPKINFTLQITGETSDQNLERYSQTLKAQGQEALLNAIGAGSLGTFTFASETRVVNLVRERRVETGLLITAVFGRLLGSSEAMCGADPKDNLFGYVELFIGNAGKSDGSLFLNASIRIDESKDNVIGVINYGTYPARVMNLEVKKST